MKKENSPNRLANEKSPYLLQHAHNPVDWYPWGDEAFQAARDQNKPIFLSIGYSTCYWCHMMEKDSFEIPEVAAVMNEHCINIKVDREEHPDVDQIYMDAVMAMTGRGGWPMSVFLTPDLKPFFGGTFFWNAQFVQIIQRVSNEWRSNPKNILEFGDKLVDTIASTQQKDPQTKTASAEDQKAVLQKALTVLSQRFDPVYGGFGPAPKFPHSGDIGLLLHLGARSPRSKLAGGGTPPLQMATQSLRAMASGGIFDHVGGGFHRYSTDERWFAPHFEKMLYDNALLVPAYLEAFQITKDKQFESAIKDTIGWVLREMTAPDGGFFSALDAGDVGEEGDFYTWKISEIEQILSPAEMAILQSVYNVTTEGNWEHGKNILFMSLEQIPPTPFIKGDAEGGGIDPVVKLKQKLFTIRSQRSPLRRDDKILTSWNGLMIAALAQAYQVFGDTTYLKTAQKSADFIFKNLYRDGVLLRRFCDGDARFTGTLDDHAFLIHGLLKLHAVDFDDRWLNWVKDLQSVQDDLFWDEAHGGYAFTAASEKNLVVRKIEFHDGAIPSGNAISAMNLLRMSDLKFPRPLGRGQGEGGAYFAKANQIIASALRDLSGRSPLAYAYSLIAIDFVLNGDFDLAVGGCTEDGCGL